MTLRFSRKRVFVVTPDYWDTHGDYGAPLAAFTTRQKMNTWLRRYEKQPHKDGTTRQKHTVDLDPVLPPPPKVKKPRSSSR